VIYTHDRQRCPLALCACRSPSACVFECRTSNMMGPPDAHAHWLRWSSANPAGELVDHRPTPNGVESIIIAARHPRSENVPARKRSTRAEKCRVLFLDNKGSSRGKHLQSLRLELLLWPEQRAAGSPLAKRSWCWLSPLWCTTAGTSSATRGAAKARCLYASTITFLLVDTPLGDVASAIQLLCGTTSSSTSSTFLGLHQEGTYVCWAFETGIPYFGDFPFLLTPPFLENERGVVSSPTFRPWRRGGVEGAGSERRGTRGFCRLLEEGSEVHIPYVVFEPTWGQPSAQRPARDRTRFTPAAAAVFQKRSIVVSVGSTTEHKNKLRTAMCGRRPSSHRRNHFIPMEWDHLHLSGAGSTVSKHPTSSRRR